MKRLVFALICVFALVAVVSADTALIYASAVGSDRDEYSTPVTWSDLRSGGGGSTSASYFPAEYTGYSSVSASTTTNKYNQIRRTYYNFPTQALPDATTISAATFVATVWETSTNLGDVNVNVVNHTWVGPFGDSTPFVQWFGTARQSNTNKTVSSMSTPQFYNWTMNAAGIANISKVGTTSTSLRLAWDTENTSPTWVSAAETYILWGSDPFYQLTYTAYAPTAAFSANVTVGTSPLPVKFTDASTNMPTTWHWYWSADEIADSTDQNPTTTLTSGTYNVRLYANNSAGGDWENKTAYIAVNGTGAAFSANRTSGTSPLAVKFTDASTGNPVSWKWYWWGNETLSSSEQNPEFSFPEGTYNIRLNATNIVGESDWENKTGYIVTGEYKPTADFTGTPTSGTPGLLVSFTDLSTYGTTDGLVCNWSFGDSLSTQPYSSTCGNVQHVYIYAGVYDVNYTIVNDNGTSSLLRTGYISASTNQQTQTTYYNPRQVGLTFQDSSFKTLDNLQIVATPLNFTAPDNWTELLIGIQPSINILGTSVFGTTDSGGGIVFPMVQSIRYNIDASGTTSNGRVVSALNFTLYPSQEDYLITLPVDGAVGPLTTIPPTNYISYTLTNSTFNSTAQMINLTYTDPTSGTDNVTFFYRDVEGNISYVESVVGAGANAVSLSTFVIEPSSGTVEYGFIANQSSLGTISQTRQLFYVNFVGLTPGGVWTWVEMWTAIGIIVLVSALFSRSSVPLGGIIIVGLTGFFTWGIGWIHPAYGYATMFYALFILGGYAVLLYMRRAEDMIS